MHRRALLNLLIVAAVVFAASSAAAAPRDAAARKKIDAAVNQHYLSTDFDLAEATLTGAIKDCGGQCSPAIVAKAWMYVGIVRGSGRNDQRGAKDAFTNALAVDSKVVLDEALATPATKKTFADARASKSSADTASSGADEGGEKVGTMECSPKVSEVQTRRPIPVSCTTDTEAAKADLRYKAGGEAWKSIKMKKKKGGFQATIPCSATQKPGSLRFYVRARDSSGDPVDSYGKKSAPSKIEIAKETDEEPPSFPDKEAPARCSRSAAEAEKECSSNDDCESGLSCVNGTCSESQSCEADADCPNGAKCTDGKCEAAKKRGGPFKQNWLGLHFAYDFALVGGSDVCSQDSQTNGGFACFYKDTDTQYRFNPQPGTADKITTGIAPATKRVLISYDRALGDNITAGGRLGYAFGGGPPSGKAKDVKFLPYHLELRVSYWFGDRPLSKSGFRPYVGAEAGAAQVDAKLPVTIADCAGTPDGLTPSGPNDKAPKDPFFSATCAKNNLPPGQTAAPLKLDAYKKLGQGFLGLHAGIVYAIGTDSGIQLNLNVMQMLPTRGQVIEPSLGYIFGL